MKKTLETLLRATVCLLMAVTVSSCVYEDGIDVPDEPAAEACDVSFKFNIYTGENDRTRALGVWEESPANVAERILSPSDMMVHIFDGNGALLTSVKPNALEYKDDPTANDGYYSLSVFFTSSYFDQYKDTDNVSFFVVILANLESVGGSYTTFLNSSTLWTNVQESFTMAPDWFPSTSGGIPMYGYKALTVKKSELTESAVESPLGSINMIRALSKLEVTDKIVNKAMGNDGKEYPRVTAVEMISWVDDGYLVPKDFDYQYGLYSANIPTYATATTQRVQGVWVDGSYRIYCPEAKLKDITLRVSALLEPGGETKHYDLQLGQFEDEYGTADIVRNHIYRFDVHAVHTAAEFTVAVADWESSVNEYEIEDVVGVEPEGFLQWSYSNPDNFSVSTVQYDNREEKQLSMLNSTTDYATGTFQIQSPKGATWKAYFVPGENGVDAFEFVDIDETGAVVSGSERVYAEGDVGVPSTIHIRGKGPADAYRHTAELVIEVHTVDGATLLMPLTPMSTRYIIYRENKL